MFLDMSAGVLTSELLPLYWGRSIFLWESMPEAKAEFDAVINYAGRQELIN